MKDRRDQRGDDEWYETIVTNVIYAKRRGEMSLLEKCVKQYDNSFLPMFGLCLAFGDFPSTDNGI